MNYEDQIAEQEAREFLADAKAFDHWLPAARYSVQHGAAVSVDGTLLDLFSASAMVRIYDALSPANQAKLVSMPMLVAHDMVFKLMAKVGVSGG